jgi:hypothetical protein
MESKWGALSPNDGNPHRDHMAPTHATFDFDQLTFADALKASKAGGTSAQVGYGPNKDQVYFQLGVSPKDTLRCAFGLDRPEKEPEKPYFKLELTEDTQAFVEKLEASLLEAAGTNSVAWFKKQHSPAALQSILVSNIKPQNDAGKPDCVKIKFIDQGQKNPTVVLVTEWKNGKLRKPVEGSVDDLVQGAMVLAEVKVKNGVWFMNKTFGVSLAASLLLVIKPEGATSTACGKRKLEMGGVEFTDGEEDEDDE